MDVQMPVMNGLESTRQIRELEKKKRLKKNTIIALTANAMQNEHNECMKAGMDAYQSKPFRKPDLIRHLQYFLERQSHNKTDIISVAQADNNGVEDAGGDSMRPSISQGLYELSSSIGKEMMPDLINSFLVHCQRDIEELRQAVERKDITTVQEKSHRIKGASANYGLIHLMDMAKEMQQQTKLSDFEAMEKIASKMWANFSLAKTVVQEVMDEMIKQ